MNLRGVGLQSNVSPGDHRERAGARGASDAAVFELGTPAPAPKATGEAGRASAGDGRASRAHPGRSEPPSAADMRPRAGGSTPHGERADRVAAARDATSTRRDREPADEAPAADRPRSGARPPTGEADHPPNVAEFDPRSFAWTSPPAQTPAGAAGSAGHDAAVGPARWPGGRMGDADATVEPLPAALVGAAPAVVETVAATAGAVAVDPLAAAAPDSAAAAMAALAAASPASDAVVDAGARAVASPLAASPAAYVPSIDFGDATDAAAPAPRPATVAAMPALPQASRGTAAEPHAGAPATGAAALPVGATDGLAALAALAGAGAAEGGSPHAFEHRGIEPGMQRSDAPVPLPPGVALPPSPMRSDAPAVATASLGSIAMPSTPGIGFDDSFDQRIAWMADQRITQAEMRVSPEGVGPIDVRLQIEGHRVTAQFNAANADVRQALEAGMDRLRELLGQRGMELADAQVGRQGTQRDPNARQQAAGTGLVDIPEGTTITVGPLLRARGLIDTYA